MSLTGNAALQLSYLRRAVFRCLQDTLPIQEPDRIIIVVDIPDWPKVCEIDDSVLGEVRHIVDDTVGLVAIVPGYRRDAAVFDAASDFLPEIT